MEINMKNKTKMNGLYKTGFILLMVCIPLFLAAIGVAYLYDIYFSVIFSGSGAFLAFLGIIFTMASKPKKQKKVRIDDEISENAIDNDFSA